MVKARLKPGDVIDGFLIEDIAHNGGMARIWQVSRPDIDFPILMKVPVIGEGDDPAAIVGFEMEQMILPRLSGPHVPRFVANGDFSTLPYIVMERLPGASLYPLLERLPLPPEEVAALGAKIAVALDSLHRQHVVHLDLKPSNVMFPIWRPNRYSAPAAIFAATSSRSASFSTSLRPASVPSAIRSA
jgi:serine/threonine protein kinase